MKHFLLALFILSVGFIKSQCTLTTSVTPETCPGTCDGKVTINLSPGCTAFPYNLVINGGTCTPTGTFVMTSSSMTFSNLCGCSSPFNVVLYNSLSIPVTFTVFTLFSGLPLTVVPGAFPATCSSCCDGSVTANVLGGTGPYSYSWTPPVSTGSVLNNACPGAYTICVSDTKGCTTCTTTTVNFIPLSITEYSSQQVSIKSSKDEIIITNILSSDVVIVYDLTGRAVHKSEVRNEKEVRIQKDQFTKGIYVVSIENEKRVSRHKILID